MGWNHFYPYTPNGVLLNGTLEDGFVGALGFGINTTEDCSEVSEVENPFGYDLESFEDVFPSIGEINLDSLYPSIEFSENDLLFIIDGSEVDLSLFDENGLNIYPQEVNGYLIFGPFDINDVLTIDINDIEDLLISWGFFEPMNDEIISQGTFLKDDPNYLVFYHFLLQAQCLSMSLHFGRKFRVLVLYRYSRKRSRSRHKRYESFLTNTLQVEL